MRQKQTVIVNLPFSGFYDSLWSEAIDREESEWIEYHTGDTGEIDADYEFAWPEVARLTDDEYAEIFMDCTNYGAAYQRVAKAYVDAFSHVVGEKLGLKLGFKFESMVSPREYNFATDRVFAEVRLGVMLKLFRRSRADGHKRLAEVIRERFTSYDGFFSHYSNRLDDWLAKPLRDWDHNELGTLLMAALPPEGNRFSRVLQNDIYDLIAYGDGFYEFWTDAVDWPKFEAARDELRQEKIAAARALDPKMPAIEPRCPQTGDLFRPRL
jgi:hypothetical protein